MKISSAFPSNYVKAADLMNAERTVVISSVAMEDIGGDHKPVLHFQNTDKGMVLNKTNANTIAEMYGDDTDGWLGKAVTLFPTWTDFQGKQVEAIRVKPRIPTVNAGPAPSQAPAGTGGVVLDDSIPFAPEWR